MIEINDDVKNALQKHQGIVVLESAVITHGLPKPENFNTAHAMEKAILEEGVTPATICLLNGKIRIGLTTNELHDLSNAENVKKISIKDIASVEIYQVTGGTTVAATITLAYQNRIKVFATGGIGGVHRGGHFDISADLHALSINPILVVCSGAKSILDLPATREYLETLSIPVIGYQTDEFPAFFSKSSGLAVDFEMDTAEKIVEFAKKHWSLGLKTAVLVTVPPPKDTAIPNELIDEVINHALFEAEERHITGSEITPFLLQRVNVLTKEKSMAANIALLINNAHIAGKIAGCFNEAVI